MFLNVSKPCSTASAAVSAAGVRGFHRSLGAVRLSREVSRGLSVVSFLGSGGPNCFRFRQIPRLLGPNGFNGFSPVDARPEAWRAATPGAERGERGAGEREEKRRAGEREEKRRAEKRREGRSVAFVPLVDGAPGRALASLGLRGSCRTRGLRPHPISACPVIDVDQLRWIPPPPPPPPDSTEIRS